MSDRSSDTKKSEGRVFMKNVIVEANAEEVTNRRKRRNNIMTLGYVTVFVLLIGINTMNCINLTFEPNVLL